MALPHEDVTGAIIGAAIEVHATLGPGYIESIYENALSVEFRRREIPYERQVSVPVVYRQVEAGLHRLDVYVADLIIVELKAVKEIQDVHFAIVPSCLRAVGRHHGLILNFATTTLEVKRVMVRA